MISLLVALASAATVEGPVYPTDLGKTYVLSNYQETRMGQHPRDQVPQGLDRSLVRDEARILSLEGERACFEVITRTSVVDENLMGTWEFTVGKKTVVWPESEEVQVFDYAYTGERTKLDLAIFGQSGGGGLRITEPEERVFRVIERTRKVCGASVLDKKGRVTLRVDLKAPHNYDESYTEQFRWVVQPSF